MKIAICGFYGKSNFGDDLMASELSRILSSNGNNQVALYSDTNSPNIKNGLVDKSYLQSDIIVIGGGGIVTPYFWALKNNGIRELINSKKTICFINVNVTPDLFYNKVFAEQIKELSANWWVRDNASIELLSKLSIEASFLPDISTFIDRPDKTVNPRKKLAVFLNSYVLNNIASDDSRDFLKAHNNSRIIASYLNWMCDFNWEVHFYACQTSWEYDDRICSGYVYSLMKNKRNAVWHVDKYSWEDLFSRICCSDLLLSMRYHPTVIALMSNIPTVDIVHHDKNKNTINELGLMDISISYNCLCKEQLISSTQKAENTQLYIDNINEYKQKAIKLWNNFTKEWGEYTKGV